MRRLLCLLVLAGCEGRISSPPPVPIVSEPLKGPCANVAPAVGTWPLQRLTSQQLERTVEAVLFDQTHAYAQRLGSTDEVLNARLRYFFASSGNAVVAEGLILAAEKVSEAAMTTPQLAAGLACTAADLPGQRLCARKIVQTLGRRLWRRTLTSGDVDTMLAVYDLARIDGTFTEGLQSTLHALLASPDFFFLQQPSGTSGVETKLTGTVLAERLALTLWQEAPDAALLAAAESGALDCSQTRAPTSPLPTSSSIGARPRRRARSTSRCCRRRASRSCTPILDNTIVVVINERSHSGAHNNSNMPIRLYGNARGGFATGRYLALPQTPLNNVWISLANAMGVPITTFGEPRFDYQYAAPSTMWQWTPIKTATTGRLTQL